MITIIVVVVILLIFLLGEEEKVEDVPVFHVTLADPEQYEDGIYSRNVVISEGKYNFRFVPNGDSPKRLVISLQGQDFQFLEEFILNGTVHQTGISEYYTWDYDGEKSVIIENKQEIKITINPNGNINGPVSVSLIEN